MTYAATAEAAVAAVAAVLGECSAATGVVFRRRRRRAVRRAAVDVGGVLPSGIGVSSVSRHRGEVR